MYSHGLKNGFSGSKVIFSERVIRNVLDRGCSHKEIGSRNKNINFLDLDSVVIPIFQSHHWSLAYFNLITKKAYYLDSLGSDSVSIIKFLGAELFGKGCVY